MRQVLAFSAALFVVFSASTVAAQYSTPGALAVRFEPEAFELGEYKAFEDVVGKYNYSYVAFVNLYLDTYPDVSTWDLVAVYNGAPGWLYFMSHSSATAFETEAYELSDAGRAARDVAYNDLKNVYGIMKIIRYTHHDETGTDRYYAIGVTSAFVAGHFTGDNALVHHMGCWAWELRDEYLARGTRAYVSYDDTLTNVQMFSHANTFYSRLMTPSRRVVRDAATGINTHFRVTDLNGTVLAPVVRAVSVAPGSVISRSANVTVSFDCRMNQVPASDVLLGSGSIVVTNPSWSGADQIICTVAGRYRGPGQLIIDSYNPRQLDLSGAMSEIGHIGLDGNQEPWTGDAGIAPNGDDYVVALTSNMGGDNPAALVEGFTVTRGDDGTHLRWTVEFEHRTEKYLVEWSPTWAGPYSLRAEVPATGSPSYEIVDPARVDGIYRLREVELTGDTLIHGTDEVHEPFSIDPEQAIGVNTDSLLHVQTANYPTISPQGTTRWDWVCIVPQAWKSAATPLANFWGSKGYYALVTALEDIGGPAGINAYLNSMRQLKCRYALLVGDANDYVWWSNASIWVNGWTRPTWPTQQQYNIVPSFYTKDKADSQHVSMSWYTPYWGSDWGYVDFDGDSLPEMALGRAPVRSASELTLFVQKTINAASMPSSGGYLDHVGLWVYGHDDAQNSGEFAVQMADSLQQEVPTRLTVRKLSDTPANPLSYPQREALAISALNEGRSLILTYGTVANRSRWVMWLDQVNGFTWSRTSPTSILPFLLGTSCGLGDIDRTENPTYGRPLLERALLEPDRGPWGGFGPTRGSWQHGDYLFAREFLQCLYRYGASSAGEAAVATVSNIARLFPEYKDLAMSYMFIGDPLVHVPNMRVVVGIGGGDNRHPNVLRLLPNPSRGRTTIQYILPVASEVHLDIFDLAGRVARSLMHGKSAPGIHALYWDGADNDGRELGTGVYFVRLNADRTILRQKIVLLR